MAKILIIGGGVAGLSAGIYARKQGHRAIVCERQSTAGGNLTGWQRGEYHIDNCIHWLTGTNPNTSTYRTWTELGALNDTPIYQADTLYTCEWEGKRLSLHKDLSVLQGDMLKLSPADKKEILGLIKAVETLQGLFGIAGENHNRKTKPFRLPTLLRYYRLSTGELSDKFSHPLLQKFLSCFIGRQFASLALLIVFATFCGENGGLPVGGSLAMAQRMTDRFLSLGGELLLQKDATKIHVRKGKATSVSFADGTNIRADYIVCATDAKITFEQLLRRPLPKALQKQYNDPEMWRFSSYHTAFSCPSADLPFSGDLIFELSEKYKEKLSTEYLILREFSHEQSFAPKGQTVLQTLTFCNEQTARDFIALRNDVTAYQQKKQELAETMQEIITKKFPKLKGKIKCLDVWTPATYQRYTRSEMGSWMSFVLPKNRLPRRISGEIDGLTNVVLATQWQQAPGGLPTAADMGKRAIEQITRRELRAVARSKSRRFQRTRHKSTRPV